MLLTKRKEEEVFALSSWQFGSWDYDFNEFILF